MPPNQATIYDFGEVKHDRVERYNPNSTFDRVEVRLEQNRGSQHDVIDLTFDRWHATRLADALYAALGIGDDE